MTLQRTVFTQRLYIFKQTWSWRWIISVNSLKGELFNKFINSIKSTCRELLRSSLNTLSIRSRRWYTAPSLLLRLTQQDYFHVSRDTHSYWPRNLEQITKGNEILKHSSIQRKHIILRHLTNQVLITNSGMAMFFEEFNKIGSLINWIESKVSEIHFFRTKSFSDTN